MRWTKLPQTGALPVERSSHSITVIGDKILLFGGEHDPRVPVGSDIFEYSCADGTWRVLPVNGEPPSPRVAHAAAAVGNVLYVFGGRSGLAMGEGASNDLFALDLTTATWTRLQPQGTLPPKRSYHTMTAVGTKLYAFGGCGESGRLNDLHEYDTVTNTWNPLAAPSSEAVPGRGGSCLVAVPPGGAGKPRLYVVAGFCGRELDDMHVFSIPDNAWCGAGCPSCSETHSDHTPGSDQDKAQALSDAATASKSPHCKLSARSVFGAGLHDCDRRDCAHKGALLAFGGEVDPSDKGHDGAGDFCASLMEYAAAAACGGCPSAAAACSGGAGCAAAGWRALQAGGESPGPRGWFAAAMMPDGRLVVHGGLDANNERLGDMFVLDVHAE